MALKRTVYQDKWNKKKTWEVTNLVGGYYLRQYIDGKQFGSGIKTSKSFIESIGILEFPVVSRV